MPRAERIEYENAYYHVMNRGRGRRAIYHGKAYYEAFLLGLEEAHVRFGLEVHAYCLMGNHYHLLVKTPLGNISRCMRHINGLYTQRYNRFKGTDGPLFRGRFKAILIESDGYLAELTRYIHRNPVETNPPLVKQLEAYPWSSYPAYLNQKPALDWLYREETYQLVGHHQRYKGYRLFVERGVDEEIALLYEKKRYPAILGSKSFKKKVYAAEDNVDRLARLKRLETNRPGSQRIIEVLMSIMGVQESEIVHGRRGQRQVVRWMGMYLCQTLGGMTLGKIAKTFNVTHVSGVSHQIRQFKALLNEDKETNRQYQLAIQYLTP